MNASWFVDKIEQWPTVKLVPYARNARTHSQDQVAQIAASIAEFGFTNPILAGIRAFGSETELQTVAGVMAQHLQTMRNKHAITLEHLRFGALKGQILDADGSIIYDLYNEFEITPKTFTFDITDPANGFDVKKTCLDVIRYVEDNLQGDPVGDTAGWANDHAGGSTRHGLGYQGHGRAVAGMGRFPGQRHLGAFFADLRRRSLVHRGFPARGNGHRSGAGAGHSRAGQHRLLPPDPSIHGDLRCRSNPAT